MSNERKTRSNNGVSTVKRSTVGSVVAHAQAKVRVFFTPTSYLNSQSSPSNYPVKKKVS
jgi:hypothetical protein